MLNKNLSLPKISIFMFGAFALSLNLSSLLHELAHAVMMIAIGGSVEKITLTAFSSLLKPHSKPSRRPALEKLSWMGALCTAISAIAVIVLEFIIF